MSEVTLRERLDALARALEDAGVRDCSVRVPVAAEDLAEAVPGGRWRISIHAGDPPFAVTSYHVECSSRLTAMALRGTMRAPTSEELALLADAPPNRTASIVSEERPL